MESILFGRRNRKLSVVRRFGRNCIFVMDYVEGKPSQINIESVNDSIAYCISKVKLETLFSHSLEMANFGRKIFEREILSVDASTLAYGAPPTAKERYLTLMEENPELLQDVPLKYLASYLYITPQSLSRIRAGLRKKD